MSARDADRRPKYACWAGFFRACSENKCVFTRIRKPYFFSGARWRIFRHAPQKQFISAGEAERKRPMPPRIHPRRPPHPNRKRPGANSEPLLAYPQLPEVKLIPTSGLLRSGLGALVQDGKSFIREDDAFVNELLGILRSVDTPRTVVLDLRQRGGRFQRGAGPERDPSSKASQPSACR